MGCGVGLVYFRRRSYYLNVSCCGGGGRPGCLESFGLSSCGSGSLLGFPLEQSGSR